MPQSTAMKTLLVLMLVAVLGALASAGLFMLKKREPGAGADPRMARALALRVGLSVAIFLFILLGWWMGWMKPTGIPVGI
jgi:hypothetical protein